MAKSWRCNYYRVVGSGILFLAPTQQEMDWRERYYFHWGKTVIGYLDYQQELLVYTMGNQHVSHRVERVPGMGQEIVGLDRRMLPYGFTM